MKSAQKTRVLFVCIGNSCRSPMAEALARHLASDVIDPVSAGISPFGRIVEPTRKVLQERGIAIGAQYSKGLDEVDPDKAHLIVNMSGMPGKALFPGDDVVDWDIDDPYGEDLGTYRRVRDDLEELITKLATDLRKKQPKR